MRSFEVHIPVALAAGEAREFEVAGTLALPDDSVPSHVQLLLHGSTYGRSYWDFPLEPERYSYVRHMTDGAWATLAIDRIGIGGSSHPPPERVDCGAQAFVTHQLVEALRNGSIEGFAFSDVVLVGHSLGSAIAIGAAARFQDVDGIVVTGLLHHVDLGLALVPASVHPARLDHPRFNHLPLGYTTTRPGQRALFYNMAMMEPAVLGVDEELKETVTAAELATFALELPRSSEVNVPVLVVVGDCDKVFCSLVRCSQPLLGGLAFERAAWTTTCYQQLVVPRAGHSLNLHPDAPLWYAQVRAWGEASVGPATPAACRRRG